MLAALVGAALCACPDSGAGECGSPADCAPPDDAPCEACAPPSVELCVDAACVPRPDDEVDLSATFLIERGVEGVQGLLFAVAPGAACEPLAGGFPAALNVLLSGQRSLSGGDLHPDVGLGRIPAGAALLYALATDAPAGEGAVVARGCVGFTATAPSTSAPQLTLEP
ncbi:MAG: hypothetical protein A2138_07555 [Deltaproteobacteria bacterium RBG_16_71_12]|nr:MAG: hypothetical protein A2138_07555 [Deltaproteobacteria bacterium RBG_16_71_12]